MKTSFAWSRPPTGRSKGFSFTLPGEAEGGFRVVDVWESQEAAQRFGERLMSALQEAGIEAQPEMYEAHTFVSA